MKCESCGKATRINWGDPYKTILCEVCSNSDSGKRLMEAKRSTKPSVTNTLEKEVDYKKPGIESENNNSDSILGKMVGYIISAIAAFFIYKYSTSPMLIRNNCGLHRVSEALQSQCIDCEKSGGHWDPSDKYCRK
jgi:hypothetical protein